jgi:hypothetical protein
MKHIPYLGRVKTGVGHQAIEKEILTRQRFLGCWFQGDLHATLVRREQMTNPMTHLDAYTDEELEQELALVLAHARGEVLNDAEVQRFQQLNEQILRRRAASGNAA